MNATDALEVMANAVRALSIDMVEAAGSGHPGMPLGAADVATVLFSEFMKHNPADPQWARRDRFVLSAGHASAMLYALLHLSGYPLTMEDLRAFRQLHSPTSGHPEYLPAKGIECTTGPLGQGIGMAVGIAIAEAMEGASLPEEDRHRTWVLAGDGCLMEGISHEACSLAGRLGLERLTVIYDANNNTIDGTVDIACTDDPRMRFESYRWATKEIDGHDVKAIREAFRWAAAQDRPTLIVARTTIGKFSTLADSHKAHGTVLGDDYARKARIAMGMGSVPFEIPAEATQRWSEAIAKLPSVQLYRAGDITAGESRLEFSVLQEVTDHYKRTCDTTSPVASRVASGEVLDRLALAVSDLVGGSADLTGPTCTATSISKPFDGKDGNFVYYGVREHGMGAIMNGIALHGPFVPYGGTFLAFADYMKPAVRLAALMGQQVIYVMTHDSIGLGEDGPTHQPIEQLSTYRSLPNLLVFRPADRIEVAEAWEIALAHRDGPSMIILARQESRPVSTYRSENLVRRGGYLVRRSPSNPDLTLVASGTELAPTIEAAEILEARGFFCDVISLPCLELLQSQPESYRERLFRSDHVLVVEAAATPGWERLGYGGISFHSMTGFGASGTKDDLLQHFGYTPDGIVAAVETHGILERSIV